RLGRIAQLVEAVVERAVLTPMHGLLTDETRDLALELRISDLVAEVAHGPHEEVLTVGEDGGERGGEVAVEQVTVGREVPRHRLQRLFERDAPGRNLAIGVARLGQHVTDGSTI